MWVEPVPRDFAKSFVEQYHNMHKYLTAYTTLGLFCPSGVLGVDCYKLGPHAGFAEAMSKKLYSNKQVWLANQSCILPGCPPNTMGVFTARSIKYIKKHFSGVRLLVTWVNATLGEVGGFIKGTNWLYIGTSTFPDGHTVHRYLYPLGYEWERKEILERWKDSIQPYPVRKEQSGLTG